MSQNKPQSRRTILKLSGVALVPAVLAGCADEGPGDEEEDDEVVDDEEEEDDEVVDDEEEEDDEVVDDEEEEEEDDEVVDDEEEEEEDDEEEEEDDENGEAIEPGEIELDGYTQGWEGVAPDEIEGEENPTLTLEEGESYEITWENADGGQHNIEIWDEDDEVVDDYETDLMDEEGETQTLEIDEVTDEMAQYVCEPHSGTMVGEIDVQ